MSLDEDVELARASLYEPGLYAKLRGSKQQRRVYERQNRSQPRSSTIIPEIILPAK
jgi:hypothetical protein